MVAACGLVLARIELLADKKLSLVRLMVENAAAEMRKIGNRRGIAVALALQARVLERLGAAELESTIEELVDELQRRPVYDRELVDDLTRLANSIKVYAPPWASRVDEVLDHAARTMV